jgi:hypothetical protein
MQNFSSLVFSYLNRGLQPEFFYLVKTYPAVRFKVSAYEPSDAVNAGIATRPRDVDFALPKSPPSVRILAWLGWWCCTVGYLADVSGQKSIFEKSTEVEHKVT